MASARKRNGPQEPAGSAQPGRLPPLGALVRAALPTHDVGLRSQIQDVVDDELVIAAPVEADDVAPLQAGETLTLSWTNDRGLHRLRVVLRERIDDPPRWRVEIASPVAREQRRDSYRVPVMGTVGLWLPDRWWTARLVDVSEGGLRCLLPGDLVVPEGTACEVSLDVVRPGLRLPGEVLRVREGVDAMLDLGIRLTDVAPPVADELRRYVFDVQLAQRQAEP